MKLESSAFKHEEKIPSQFTCDGDDTVPPLLFIDTPAHAQSLVLVVSDPDSVAGTWSHWVVWNIPADTTVIEGGVLPPQAQEGTNDFGHIGYGGPCPTEGAHRYFFTVYALDAPLTLVAGAQKKEVEKAMKGHVVDQAELQSWYQRA